MTGAALSQTLTLLKKDGVYVPQIEKCDKIDQAAARRMRLAGATLKTIADRYGVTIPSVQQVRNK